MATEFCPKIKTDLNYISDYWNGSRLNFEFVAYLVIVPIQAVLGIFGNVVALSVTATLSDEISSFYLKAVALFNATSCCIDLFYPFAEKVGLLSYAYFPLDCTWNYLVRKILIPLSRTVRRSSLLIMTFFFLDRFIVVTYPAGQTTWRSLRSLHYWVPKASFILALALSLPTINWYTLTKCIEPGYAVDYQSSTKDRQKPYVFYGKTMACNRVINARTTSFVVYEVVRECLLVYLPVTAMAYFAVRISMSIAKFKIRTKRARQKKMELLSAANKISFVNSKMGSELVSSSQIDSAFNGNVPEKLFRNDKAIVFDTKSDHSNFSVVDNGFKMSRLFSVSAKVDGTRSTLVGPDGKGNFFRRKAKEYENYMKNKRVVVILIAFIAFYCSSIIPSSILTLIYTVLAKMPTIPTESGNTYPPAASFNSNYSDPKSNLTRSVPSLMTTKTYSHLYNGNYVALSTILDQANYCWCFYLYTILDSVFRHRLVVKFSRRATIYPGTSVF